MSESLEHILSSLKMFYTRRHYCFYSHDDFTGNGNQCIGDADTRGHFRYAIGQIFFDRQREFREFLEVGADERFALYKLAVS